MANRTISVAGGDWDNVAGTWDELLVPTAEDDVVARGGTDSGNISVVAAGTGNVCRSAVFTNYVNTLAIGGGRELRIGDASGGNLTLVSGMTFTPTDTSSLVSFISTTTGNTITTAAKNFPAVTFNGAGGGWSLAGNMTMFVGASYALLTLTAGSVNLNGNNITCLRLSTSNANVRALTMGSGTFTITGPDSGGNRAWHIATSTNMTLTANTSTIAMTYVGATGRQFAGGGLTYYNLAITTGGAGATTITGSNSFNAISVAGGSTTTIKFTDGTTQTLTGGVSAFPSGAASNLITLSGTSTGGWTISTAVNLSCDYLSISYCNVVGGGKLYCGVNSTDGGNNDANVIFTAPPSGPPVGTFAMLGIGR